MDEAPNPEDSMIFDVPKDKWSTFFGTADKPEVFEQPAAEIAEEPAEKDTTAETEAAEELMAEIGSVFGDTSAETPSENADAGPAGENVQDEYDDNWQDMEHVQSVVLETSIFSADGESSDADNDAESATNEDSWDDAEPDEEIVMKTGLFGAAEISTSREDGTDTKLGDPQTHADEDWKPDDWNADSETEDPG